MLINGKHIDTTEEKIVVSTKNGLKAYTKLELEQMKTATGLIIDNESSSIEVTAKVETTQAKDKLRLRRLKTQLRNFGFVKPRALFFEEVYGLDSVKYNRLHNLWNELTYDSEFVNDLEVFVDKLSKE